MDIGAIFSTANFDRFRRPLIIGAVASVGLYLVSGAWPLVPVFGDSMAIASGAEQIKGVGPGPNALTYWYSQHPGAHLLTAGVSLVTGLSTTTALLLLCALAAIVAVAAAAATIVRLLGVPWPLALISVLLFQEAWTAGYYGNSTVLASAFAFGALYLLAGNRGPVADLLAALAFAGAGFMRLDAVLAVPAALVLILQQGRENALRRLALVGGVAGSALGVALFVSGFSIDEVRASLAFKDALFASGRDLQNSLRSLAAYFSVLCVMLALSGSVLLVRDRRWDLLALVAAGVLPTALLFAGGVDTPRYLTYLLPFVALVVAVGLHALWPPRRQATIAWAIVLLAAFAGQYLLSYELRSAEGRRGLAVLAAIPTDGEDGRVRMVLAPPALGMPPLIGVGNNGGRLAAGLVMAPHWHQSNKQLAGMRSEAVAAALEDLAGEDRRIITMGWNQSQIVISALLSQGYRLADHQRGPDWRWDRYAFTRADGNVYFSQYRHEAISEARRLGIDAVVDDLAPGAVLVAKRYSARGLRVEGSDAWRHLDHGVYLRIR